MLPVKLVGKCVQSFISCRSCHHEMTNFLDLPEEVIESGILPYLKWNELLRFRRVCKTTKDITDCYIRVHPDLAPEIEINENSQNAQAFLEMGIPTTKFYINNNSGDDFYEKNEESLIFFLKKFGPIIKSLRVRQLSLYVFGKELDFMASLVSLQSLEIGYIGCWTGNNQEHILAEKRQGAAQDPRFSEEDPPITKIFANLKTLKIGQERTIWEPIRPQIDNLGRHFLQVFTHTSLESACLPFSAISDLPDIENRQTRLSLYRAINFVKSYILQRAQNFPNNPNLKLFDFANFYHPNMAPFLLWNASSEFPSLCQICLQHDVKLAHVPARWFLQRHDFPRLNSPEMGNCIKSLVDLHPYVLDLEMTSLEEIDIASSSTASVGVNWRRQRWDWSTLKILRITVDSTNSFPWMRSVNGYFVNGDGIDTSELFHFFFQDIVRPELKELVIDFAEDVENLAIPKTEDIVASCPNLRKIRIVNWPGSSQDLAVLWEELRHLEDVSLGNCKGLEDVAFWGKDATNPGFLRLLRLKKLSLKGLDKMPGITDALFKHVIRHLPLSRLVLTSDAPVRSVTLKGIRYLLKGRFAETIEKFSFQSWRLANVSAIQFNQMEKQFQSYNML